MSVEVSKELLLSVRMTRQELLLEIAVMLFEKEKLTLGQASQLAELNRTEFQHLLASRDISPHYDVDDFEEDLMTLKRLKRL